MAIITQGTMIYFIDPDFDSAGAGVVKVDCPNTFSPGGNPADQLEDFCLEASSKAYMPGLRTPGKATMSLKADPSKASHVRMHELSELNPSPTLKWAVGWSDGTAEPTLDSNDEFVLPTSRTWFTFQGYIEDFPFDFAINTLVTSAVSIQRSGGSQWIGKV